MIADPILKRCSTCSQVKSLGEFSPKASAKTGRHSQCKKCRREIRRARAEAINLKRRKAYKNSPRQRAALREACKRYRESNRDYLRQKYKERHIEQRKRILAKYGGKCACPGCGETRFEFLAIDHKNGNGDADRLRCGGASNLYALLDKSPVLEGYRLLCHNCNCARGFYGYCPHDKIVP